MSEKIPFTSVLAALTNQNANFPARLLREFSDLVAVDRHALRQTWPQVELNRRRNLVRDLNEAYREDNLLSFDEVAEIFFDDPDAFVRAQGVRLLEETTDTRILRRLLTMGNTDPDIDVRTEIATILGQFVLLAEEERLSPTLKEQVEETLLQAAREGKNAHLQRAALESLGYSSRPEVPNLIEAAFQRPDSAWAASALLAIGRSYDHRWAEHILTSLQHDDNRVRLLAAQAAGDLELKAAAQPLLDMLEEEDDDEVLEAIIWAVSQIGGEDVRDYLQALLDTVEDEDLIEYINEALTNLSFTEDLEGFDLLAYDEDDDLHELEDWDDEDNKKG